MNISTVTSADFNRITGEFLSQEKEQQFLTGTWQRTAMQLRIVIGIALLMILVSIFDDKEQPSSY